MRGERTFYFLCLGLLFLCMLAAAAFRRNRSGRVLLALRDNQRAAQAFGVDATATRLSAFAIAGAIAALAGALAAYQSQVDPGSYTMDISLTAFLYAVVGGLTSLPGAVLGTIGLTAIGYFGGQQLSVLSSGVGVSIVLYVFPGGLAQAAQDMRDGALRWLAEKHQIHVPSLVADSRTDELHPSGQSADEAVLRAAAGHVKQVGVATSSAAFTPEAS